MYYIKAKNVLKTTFQERSQTLSWRNSPWYFAMYQNKYSIRSW